jgi:hypothetical protein
MLPEPSAKVRGAAALTWRGGRPNASMEQRPARYRRSVGCSKPTFSAAAACFTYTAPPRWQQLMLLHAIDQSAAAWPSDM